jgi:hypothetical protein
VKLRRRWPLSPTQLMVRAVITLEGPRGHHHRRRDTASAIHVIGINVSVDASDSNGRWFADSRAARRPKALSSQHDRMRTHA